MRAPGVFLKDIEGIFQSILLVSKIKKAPFKWVIVYNFLFNQRVEVYIVLESNLTRNLDHVFQENQ